MKRWRDRKSMRWFGRDYGAPIYQECPQIPTPAGMSCLYCSERIGREDDGFMDAGGSLFHRACFLRMIYGSIAHQTRQCHCFKGEECNGVAEGLSKREEAEKAVEHYEQTALVSGHPVVRDRGGF